MAIDEVSKNIYQIPFVGNIRVRPAPYHFEQVWQKNAVDFALNFGEPIFAAEEGIVFKVIDGNEIGRPDKSCSNKTNLVMIKHRYGEYSGYAHLKKGILVSEHRVIQAGQIIGYSGRSGYTTYSHLHFQVMVREKNNGFGGWTTVPARFEVNKKVKVLVSPGQ